MKSKFNHIKRGAWYVYQRDDLYEIYKLFYAFYKTAVEPKLGKTKSFVFEYDNELRVVTLRKPWHWKKHKIHLTNDEFSTSVYKLLNEITATGIVSAPFYSVEMEIGTTIGDKTCMRRDNLLTYKGGMGKNTGYYYLRGMLV